MKKYTVKKLDELPEAARKIYEDFKENKIFALFGEMGSGKTTLIKEICKIMNVTDNVTSPTFAVVNEYQTKKREKIFHFDFYRIKNAEEAFDLGYEDYLYGKNICFLEWPELIENLLPPNYLKIEIKADKNGTRHIYCTKI